MNFVGDYFAVIMVLILSLFYFDRKHSLNDASKCFVGSLAFTALTAVTDIASCRLLDAPSAPLWIHMAVHTLYFFVNILTTSFIALYLFLKILRFPFLRNGQDRSLL